MLFTDHNTN